MVSFSVATIAAIAGFFAQSALAMPSPTVNSELFDKRAASCTFPTPPKTSSLSAAKSITGVFDGKNRLVYVVQLFAQLKTQVEMSDTTVVLVHAPARRKVVTQTPSSSFSPVRLCSTFFYSPLFVLQTYQ